MRVSNDMVEKADMAYDAMAEDLEWNVDPCVTAGIRAALEAALADVPEPTPVEPLSDELRGLAQRIADQDTPRHARKVAAELLRRFPKPEPKQRTPEELAAEIAPYLTLTGYAYESLAELVALAKK